MTHTVYRCYDGAGRLLYVGCTNNVKRRMWAHRAARWFPQMASVTEHSYPTREEAAGAERMAIRREAPLYNVEYNRAQRNSVPCDAKLGLCHCEGTFAHDRGRGRHRCHCGCTWQTGDAGVTFGTKPVQPAVRS